ALPAISATVGGSFSSTTAPNVVSSGKAEAMGNARATPMRAAAMKYSESPVTIEHMVDPRSHSQAMGGAVTARSRAPVGHAYAASTPAHTSILRTLDRHKALPAIGRIATEVSAQATALPIARTSPNHFRVRARTLSGSGEPAAQPAARTFVRAYLCPP